MMNVQSHVVQQSSSFDLWRLLPHRLKQYKYSIDQILPEEAYIIVIRSMSNSYSSLRSSAITKVSKIWFCNSCLSFGLWQLNMASVAWYILYRVFHLSEKILLLLPLLVSSDPSMAWMTYDNVLLCNVRIKAILLTISGCIWMTIPLSTS